MMSGLTEVFKPWFLGVVRSDGRGAKLETLFGACGIAAARVRRVVILSKIVILREMKRNKNSRPELIQRQERWRKRRTYNL
jgi:hypothetical protein